MPRSPAHSSGGALSPSFLSPVASSSGRARARSSSTKSPASGHAGGGGGGGEEEDEEAWGITEGEDSDFKRRIFELTARAHSDDRGHTHALELCFDDEIEDESNSAAAASGAGAAGGGGPKSAAHATQSIDFSTACWSWQPHGHPGPSSSASSAASEEDDRMRSLSASLASTMSLESSRASSSASTPHDPTPAAAAAIRPIAFSAATNGPSSAAAGSSSSAAGSTSATAASAPAHHHHGSFQAAGLGRNMSLDCSARELGLSIQYVERLALPLLRSEIHSFFHKLLARVGALLTGLEANPVRVLRKMQAGMHSNSLATADAELKRNFAVSETQLAAQISEIIHADPSLSAEQKAAALEAAVAEPSSSASPPVVNAASPSSPLSPSPPAPVPAAAASAAAAPFAVPIWWPASLQASHASLLRMRALFSMFADGFDDSKGGASSGGGGQSSGNGHSHVQSPPRSSAAAQAAASVIGSPPARKMFGPTTHAGGGGSAFKPPSHPTPVSKTSAAHSHPRLHALPTTRSNRDGLKCLARLVQSFSLLVAMEGGAMAQATRLAVALQRMSNTLLEKHHSEEPAWMQREH